VCAPITKLPFSDKSFDIILSIWTLQYLNDEDLKCAISEMDRVLNHGGHVYIIEQMSLNGYDSVYARLPKNYKIFFGDNFLLKSYRSLNNSSDKIIGIVRYGIIPERYFSCMIPINLFINKLIILKDDEYVDYFMKFEKVSI